MRDIRIATSKGFTLIEVMIAMAIFTIVITIGMDAVLGAMQQHAVNQNTRTVMDSLNFTMEEMARNIRLSTNLRCQNEGDPDVYDVTTDMVTPQNCSLGNAELLMNDFQGKLLKYTFSSDNTISRRKEDPVSGGLNYSIENSISPPEVIIDTTRSGFTVRGAIPTGTGGDTGQPTVVIRIAGTVTTGTNSSDFAIQTTVTLRALDS